MPSLAKHIASLDEERLRRLFAKRDKIAAELAATDRAIAAAGREYWSARGVKAMPRVERLRAAILTSDQPQ